jgi:O-antigen/teichoic acid export membrane protein
MSRVRKYIHSLISGYALLGANVLYTLASVPLALHYLTPEEFGLWALVTQVCNFNALLIDFGMAGSIGRILVDYKDDQTSSGYGTVIKTSFLVLAVQGVLIALVGGMIGFWLPEIVAVPEKYWRVFGLLVSGQCALLAAMMTMRVFAFVLQAHQRYDVSNYAQLGGLMASLAALWAAFESNLGLYGLLAGAGASTLVTSLSCWWASQRLGLLPGKGRWGRANRTTFKELFVFGTDLFLLSIGCQLISASQVPVITRALGPETGLLAAAIWSIATKIFLLVQQMVSRLLDFSSAAFSEMIARGERARLQARFRDVVILTGSLSVAAGLTAALCNQSFLEIWTRGRISWEVRNDFLMALSLIIFCSTRCHIGFVGLTKQIGAMKYIYLAEAVIFVVLAYLAVPRLGLSGVIIAGVFSNLVFSGISGVRRTMQYFGASAREVVGWFGPSARLFLVMLAVALVLRLLTTQIHLSFARFALEAAGMGIVAAFCFWRIGLTNTLRMEVKGRILDRLHRWKSER